MRAFIFSLDAFIAFTLALVAIYSLIFFSSIPSSYYYLLTQAHFISRDALFSLATTDCVKNGPFDCGSWPEGKEYTVMDRILFGSTASKENLVEQTLGESVPRQFGYKLEESSDNGRSWSTIYDTKDHADEGHATVSRKLTVSSAAIAFDYESELKTPTKPPYTYNTCTGPAGAGGSPRNLLCGPQAYISSSDLVPKAGIKLVRLSVYI